MGRGGKTRVKFDDIDMVFDKVRGLWVRADPTIEPKRPAAAYLPTHERVRDAFEAGTVDPKELIREFRGPVKVRLGGLSEQDVAAVVRPDPETLSPLERHSQAMRGLTPPKYFKRKYVQLSRRLLLDQSTQGRGGRVAVRELVETEGATFEALLDRVTDTPEEAANAVAALRAFDDVLVRIGAARRAATATDRPIAEVLALYREEGDLPAYPSHESLELGVPSGVNAEGNLVFGAHRPDFSNLVWLADPDRATIEANGVPFERFALATTFLIQPVGLDNVGGRIGPSIVDAYVDWSTDIWIRAGAGEGDLAARKAAARERWNTLEADLVLKETRGHTGSEPKALRIAPRDPEALLAAVLADGAALFRALRDPSTLVGRPAGTLLGDTLGGVRYNSQGTRALPPAMLISAMLAVRRGAGDARLRARITPALNALLDDTAAEMTKARNSEEQQEAQIRIVVQGHPQHVWVTVETLGTWLLDNLELVEDFIHTARTGEWSGYQGGKPGEKGHGGLRSYAWHYRLMKDYFGRVFPS